MFVVFWVKQNKYLGSGNTWVKTIKSADKFTSLIQAQQQAGKRYQKQYKDNEFEYIDISTDSSSSLTKEEAEAAYEELRQAVETFGEVAAKIPAIMQYYQNVHSEQDKMQEDLLHKFEFMEPNNILFIKFSRMLKNCRLKRREAKDRIGYMTAISQSSIINLLDTHKNHNELIETRNYSPRIAPELFEKKGVTNNEIVASATNPQA